MTDHLSGSLAANVLSKSEFTPTEHVPPKPKQRKQAIYCFTFYYQHKFLLLLSQLLR